MEQGVWEQVGLALEFDRVCVCGILVAGGKESNQELGVGRRRMTPEAWEEKGRGTGLKTSRAGKSR